MKRKLITLSMLIGMMFVGLSATSPASAQNRQNGERRNGSRIILPSGQRQVWQGNHKRKGPKWNHGYKNYGQYRRTQVGNRRYRSIRRSYWTNGQRVYRWTRVYY